MNNLKVMNKRIEKGKIDRKRSYELSGYASIDKPWLKYYTDEQINADIPEITCYEALYNSNKNHLNEVVMDYFGKKITYKELFENIESTAKAFKHLNVKERDIVTILGVSTPELIYSFYALNRIGAIPNVVDPRTKPVGINMYLKEVDSKCLVTLDLCIPNIEKALYDTNIQHVVVFSANDSLPLGIRQIKVLRDTLESISDKSKKINVPKQDSFIKWKDFINHGNNEKIIDRPYTKNYPAAIVHTGGTTGIPKAVLLSNDNFNASMVQIKNCPVNMERGDSFLNVIVPFVAFGLVLALHAPMTLGWKSILVPKFEASKFANLVIKNKPNGVMGVPTYFKTLIDNPKMQKHNFSHFKAILIGGDRSQPALEKEINAFLDNHGGNVHLYKGYSMTEASSTATCSFDSINTLGGNGIPLVKTIISSFKPGTDEELKYGEEGELCLQTPTMMLGYYHNDEATDKVLKKHSDGNYWIHSADIGYITADGEVFTKDRIKRMIIRSGYKVFPSELENLFMNHKDVELCAVIGVYNPVDISVPKAYIVINKNADAEKVIDELKEMLNESEIPDYYYPVDYQIREYIPLTDIGKVDFMALENEEKGKVYTLK